MNGWIGEWVGIDGETNEWKTKLMNTWMDGWMDGYVD